MSAELKVAERALDILERVLTGSRERVLVVAAHPDDEILGAGVAMSRMRDVVVVHLADGAPRDRNFVPAHFTGTIEEYAATRAREARDALALAGVSEIGSLGVRDLELVQKLTRATELLAAFIRELRPSLIVTHAYEGGHPDHDAAAFAAQYAAQGRAPIAEMALYHAANGMLVSGVFLSSDTPQLTIELSEAERELKRLMLDRFATQRETLAQFPIESERFRDAPRYDFMNPPHPGPLWYETLQWPMTGSMWRRLAAEAASQVRLGRG